MEPEPTLSMSLLRYGSLSFLTTGERNLLLNAKSQDERNEEIPPRILVLVGVSGSGKTTMASKLAKLGFSRVSGVHRGVQISNIGMLRAALRLLCDGKSVIVDAPNLKNAERDTWMSLGRARGSEVELVVFYFPRKVCLERSLEFIRDKKRRAEIERKIDEQLSLFEELEPEQQEVAWYVGTLTEFERIVSFCPEMRCYTRSFYRKGQCTMAKSPEGCYHLFCPYTISSFTTTPYFNSERRAEICRTFYDWKEAMEGITVEERLRSLATHVRSAMQPGNFDVTMNYMRVLAETLKEEEESEPYRTRLEAIRRSFHSPHHRRQVHNPQIFSYREVRQHVDAMEEILGYVVPNFGRKLRANRRSRRVANLE